MIKFGVTFTAIQCHLLPPPPSRNSVRISFPAQVQLRDVAEGLRSVLRLSRRRSVHLHWSPRVLQGDPSVDCLGTKTGRVGVRGPDSKVAQAAVGRRNHD